MLIKDIDFSDIYLGESASWLTGVPGLGDPIPTPPEVRDDIVNLRRKCVEMYEVTQKEEFAVRHDGRTYRASTLTSMSETVYVLRRFPETVPDLSALHLHPSITEKLLEPQMSGLVIVAGAFSQGKTTTASAAVRARIVKYGGVAVTIEDPPEMPLEGRHGEGVCYQTWVEYGGFGYACRQAARWAPSIIFLGEVRDQESAAEALRASLNGRLVFCTLHADSVTTAIERMYSYATMSGSSSDDTASMLANGLACVLHQRLEGEPKRPKIEFLWLRGDDAQGAKNLIRTKRFEQLGSEINLQFNRMQFKRAPINSRAPSVA